MTSIKKVEANRANAGRSSGPKTANGKNNSHRNAVKHGLFSRELIVSDAEKAEVEALRRDLRSQLKPTTVLQNIGLEEMVYCTWRCKLAARQEMWRLSAIFNIPRNGDVQPEVPSGRAAMARWYGSGRRELRDGIRILEALQLEFGSNGRIPEDWKQELDSAFGVEFYELLTNWPTMSLDAIYLAHHIARHNELYKKVGSSGDDTKVPEVILDPVQSLQMVAKLIAQQLQHLHDLSRSWEQRASGYAESQNAATVDFAPRYFTTATRDLHRAVEWYAHLKERNL